MDIGLYTIKTVAFVITQPITLVGMLVMSIIFYRQNKKTTMMQKMIMGEAQNSPMELTISQVVIGILAGVFGSLMLSYLGVMFDENSAIGLIFLASLLLMYINPKYICFSYSGAIIGFFSVILNEIATTYSGVIVNIFGQSINLSNVDILKIDVVALMSLVGVLHIIEGILVFVDGKRVAIPVFTNVKGNIIGGFAFKRYWILPIALMVLSTGSESGAGGIPITNPIWWPIIPSSLSIADFNKAIISMLPLFAGLGYNSVTFTKTKSQKVAISGGSILIYGIVLIIVAQAANFNLYTKILVLIFAPLAHETMIKFNKYLEDSGEPKYISTSDSIMVLDVAPNSPAHEMGIKSGDRIIEINNRIIESEEQIINIMSGTSNFFWMKILKPSGEIKEVNYNKMNTIKKLGLVFIPMAVPKNSIVVKYDENRFSDVFDKIKNKNDK